MHTLNIIQALCCYVSIQQFNVECTYSPRIAIVGGGIGGASSAHFLRSLFGEDVLLDVYEPKEIGGRMATVEIAGREYEAGGSILHPKNQYMSEFVEILGLRRRDGSHGVFGIYNGERYVFKESSWNLITTMRLLWDYGTDILKFQSFLSDTLEEFSRIYELQKNNHAFTTVETLLNAMNHNFINMTTRETVADVLREKHFSDRFIKELAEAVMLVNYGQSTNIGGFVGSVSLAGAEPGLWSVHGGNNQVPRKLFDVSRVAAVHQEVEQIELLPENKFSVTTNKNMSSVYDMVIVATPLIREMSNISFKNFPSEIKIDHGTYHRTVATFVHGELNRTAVGLTVDEDISEILVNNQQLFFNSIAILYPVNYSQNEDLPQVWKIFSKKLLTQAELENLFPIRQSVKWVDWLAYPHYIVPCQLSSFVLYPGLFHTSSIEWAASAMEMSAIAGRNVALLAYNHWVPNKIVKTDVLDSTVSHLQEEL